MKAKAKDIFKLKQQVFAMMDIMRGAVDINEATQITLGMTLIFDDCLTNVESDKAKERGKKDVSNLINRSANDIVYELIRYGYELEAHHEKYKSLFTDFCFKRLNDVSPLVIQEVILRLYDIFKNNEDDEIAFYIFRYVTSADIRTKASEYYGEPDWLRNLVCTLADIHDGQIIGDPFVGEAGYFTTINMMLDKPQVEFIGSDVNSVSCYLAKIGLILQHCRNFIIVNNDSLVNPWLENNNLAKFDRVITDPPVGMKHPQYDEIVKDEYARFRYGLPGRGMNEWLSIQLAISSINEKGKAVVLTSLGPLFRSNEAKIRSNIINEDILEAIIELPKDIMLTTSIPFVILIFNREKPVERKNKILVIDASEMGEKKQKVSRLEKRSKNMIISPENLKKIENVYYDYKNVEGFSYIVDCMEIAKTDFNLNIAARYRANLVKEKLKGYVKLYDKTVEVTRGVQVSPKLLDELKKSHKRTHYFLNLSNIVGGEIIVGEDSLIEPQIKWVKNYQVQKGDLLIASRGNFKCAVVSNELPPAIASGNLIIIRLKQEYSPYVLKHFFESKIGTELISQIQSGVAATIINPAEFKNIMIPEYSDTQMKNLEKHLIEYTNRVKELYKAAEDYRINKSIEIDKEMNLN